MRLRFAGYAVLAACSAAGAHVSAAEPASAPTAIVQAFNAALSQRNIDTALAQIAPGAVNFTLQAAHSFTANRSGTEPLTADLATHWKTIAPVLYSVSRRYERSIVESTEHVDGHLAVVWARLRTTTEPQQGAATQVEFSESYQLRRIDTQWRIISIASSRQTR